MHTPHATRLQAGLSGLELLLLFVGVAMGGFSTVLSTKWVHNALSADGLGAMDVLLIGFAALAIFAILVVFHFIGVRVLPHLRPDMRQASLAIYGLLAVLVVFLSSGSNFQVLAQPIAQRAELNAVREEAVQDFSQTTRVAGDVLALTPVMATAAQTAEGLRQDELQRGAVCGRGAGLGRCASEIRSVTIAAAAAQSALIDARARIEPLRRQGDELVDRLQRLAANEDMAWAEKERLIARGLKDLGLITDAILEAVPETAITQAADAFLRDWEQTGFSALGAAKMKSAFAQTSARLLDRVTDIGMLDYREPITYRERTGFSLLFQHFEKTAVLFVFALLLDFLPLAAAALLLTVSWMRQDRHDPVGAGPETPATAQETPRAAQRPGVAPLSDREAA